MTFNHGEQSGSHLSCWDSNEAGKIPSFSNTWIFFFWDIIKFYILVLGWGRDFFGEFIRFASIHWRCYLTISSYFSSLSITGCPLNLSCLGPPICPIHEIYLWIILMIWNARNLHLSHHFLMLCISWDSLGKKGLDGSLLPFFPISRKSIFDIWYIFC